MKKNYAHNQLSTKVCAIPGCTKCIKKRLEDKNTICFEHHYQARHKISRKDAKPINAARRAAGAMK